MRRVLPPISAEQAKIILDALQSYQEENAAILHGFTLSSSKLDIELFTHIHSIWDKVDELQQFITATFPENPAN